MKIDLIFSAEQCKTELVKGKTAVIIDVLRSSTVIATALFNGARGIAPFAAADEALSFRERHRANGDEQVLLAGEYRCVKLPGFDLDNSPGLYTRDVVSGKIIAMVTTNGTVAIRNAMEADRLYILCMLNLYAITRRLAEDGRDVVFVCSGALGRFSLEDGICAGICIDRLCATSDCVLGDGARLLQDYCHTHQDDIIQVLYQVDHSKRLVDWGFAGDLDACFALDTINLIPESRDSLIVPAFPNP
jgi:2-phosphosulfolactate phosphatase